MAHNARNVSSTHGCPGSTRDVRRPNRACPGAHGRDRRRRAAAVGRARPAVPHRLRGDAARTADDVGAAAHRRHPTRRPAARGAARRAPPGAVRDRDVGGDRGSDRAGGGDDPALGPAGRDRRPHVGAVRPRPAARGAVVRVRARHRRGRPDPHGQGRRRDRRAHPRRARGRRDRGARCGRRRSRAAPSSTCTASWSSGCWPPVTSGRTSRSSPPAPTPRARTTSRPRRASSPTGDLVLCDFGGTMDGYCSDITRMFHVGEPTTEIRDVYAVLSAAQEAGVRAATVGHPVPGRRRRGPRRDRRRRIRRVLRAPGRPRHRHRGARRPVHGRRQRRSCWNRATRSASSPASISRTGSVCASRTSWSRPTPDPSRLNVAPRDIAIVA